MKHVVLFSGGAASYCAAKRVIERHNREDITLLYCDTKSEDEDLYRFLDDCESVLGRITRIAEGRDIWQVFKDERFLGNHLVDPCSKILKRQFGDKYINHHFHAPLTVLYVGFDWNEGHRFDTAKERRKPFVVEAPLMEKPLLEKCDMLEIIKADGIKPPRLYEMGFAHNNCGGFCIKAGISHYVHLYRVWPERYLEFERKEQEMRDFLGKDISILNDRRGGKRKLMTLRVLRARIEAGEKLPEYDWGGCGCFVEPEGE